MRPTLALFSVLALALALSTSTAAPAHAQSIGGIDIASATDVNLSLSVRTRFSPYSVVRYEYKSRGSTFIAVLTKQLVGGFGELQNLALVSDSAFQALVDRLDACGIDDIGTAVNIGTGGFDVRSVVFDVEVAIDDYHRRLFVTDDELLPGTGQWCVVEALRQQYYAVGDPVAFENTFFEEGQFGELSADSTPGARVWVDGVDTGLNTPVHHFRLAPGVHRVRFVNAELGIDREYDATIMEGITTRLQVELR